MATRSSSAWVALNSIRFMRVSPARDTAPGHGLATRAGASYAEADSPRRERLRGGGIRSLARGQRWLPADGVRTGAGDLFHRVGPAMAGRCRRVVVVVASNKESQRAMTRPRRPRTLAA